MKKTLPSLTTDDEAMQFIETADLSEYDLSDFKPVTFEFQSNMRPPAGSKSGKPQP